MEKLNASIIGCGSIHTMHVGAIQSNPHVQLVSVVDIDEGRAKAAAAEYGCDYHTDYREMLKDQRVDVVHICTPHYLHGPMAMDAMRNGKHVLVEKPMAISVSDALEMIRVSEETHKGLGVCFQNRYNKTSQKVKEILESGKAGRIKGAKAIVTWFRNAEYYTGSSWRGTWEREGGGVLINQAIHTLDLLQWFMGDINRIKSNVDTRLLEGAIEVEDTADGVIVFESGARALFYATNCYVENSPIEIEIACENALITLSEKLTVIYNNGETECVCEDNKREDSKSYWGCSHVNLIEDFYDRLIRKQRIFIDGNEGIKVLKLIDAIYSSSRKREFVRLKE